MSSDNSIETQIKIFEMFSDLIFYPEDYSENDKCEMIDFYICIRFIRKLWDDENNRDKYEMTTDGHLVILMLRCIEKAKKDSEFLDDTQEFPFCCLCKNPDIKIDKMTKEDKELLCEYHHLLSGKIKLGLMRNG